MWSARLRAASVAMRRAPRLARPHGVWQGASLAQQLAEAVGLAIVENSGGQQVYYATSGLSIDRGEGNAWNAVVPEVRVVPIAFGPNERGPVTVFFAGRETNAADAAAEGFLYGLQEGLPEELKGHAAFSVRAMPTEAVVDDMVNQLGIAEGGYEDSRAFRPAVVAARLEDGSMVEAAVSLATPAAAARLKPVFETLHYITPRVLNEARNKLKGDGGGRALAQVIAADADIRALAALALNPPPRFIYPLDQPVGSLNLEAPNGGVDYLNRLAQKRESVGGDFLLPRAAAALAERWAQYTAEGEVIPKLSLLRWLKLLGHTANQALEGAISGGDEDPAKAGRRAIDTIQQVVDW